MHQKFNHGGWHFFAQYFIELLLIILLLVIKLSFTSYYSNLKTSKPASNTINLDIPIRIIILLLTFIIIALIITITSLNSPFYFSLSVVSLSFSLGLMLSFIGITWFFYSLVVMFLGGMIVVFVYASSLRNNFVIKMDNMFTTIALSVGVRVVIQLNSYLSLIHKSLNPALVYSAGITPIVVMLRSMLLLVLFVISKVVKIEDGALKL